MNLNVRQIRADEGRRLRTLRLRYDRCGFRATGDSRPLGHTPSLTELKMERDLA